MFEVEAWTAGGKKVEKIVCQRSIEADTIKIGGAGINRRVRVIRRRFQLIRFPQ